MTPPPTRLLAAAALGLALLVIALASPYAESHITTPTLPPPPASAPAGDTAATAALFQSALRHQLRPAWERRHPARRPLPAPPVAPAPALAAAPVAPPASLAALEPPATAALEPPATAAPEPPPLAALEPPATAAPEPAAALPAPPPEDDIAATLQAEPALSPRPALSATPAVAGAAALPWPTAFEERAGVRVTGDSLRGALHHPLLKGKLTDTFGAAPARMTRSTQVRHTGWTLRAPTGHRVRAVADGLVVFAGPLKGYGLTLILEHGGGYHSVYSHLKVIQPPRDTLLKRGEPVGVQGRTGSLDGEKLYFEWRRHGQPLDPEGWFTAGEPESL